MVRQSVARCDMWQHAALPAAAPLRRAPLLYVGCAGTRSPHVRPLGRRLKHLTVRQAWAFLKEITRDLAPCNFRVFYKRVADIATGKLKVPAE